MKTALATLKTEVGSLTMVQIASLLSFLTIGLWSVFEIKSSADKAVFEVTELKRIHEQDVAAIKKKMSKLEKGLNTALWSIHKVMESQNSKLDLLLEKVQKKRRRRRR